jgi:phenylalanyl-tRNA synthetase beta chain
LKVSLNWLRDYIDIPEDFEKLANRLTMCGLAVEGIEHIVPDIEGIVVSRVTDVRKHPEADKLVICQVDPGDDLPVQVVCGAPNVVKDGIYPFAPIGSRLPGGMKIKKVKIRGEESNGMLCSGKELEISSDGDTILELDKTLKVGSLLVDALGLGDHVFDIEVTANRFDLLSHIGVAREIGAITGHHVRYPSNEVNEGTEKIEALADVHLADPVGCPRYMARVVRGVKVGPSPLWLSRRLESVGMRSVNNVVDAANYVLMELGHPLHTFDLNLLTDGKIIVRRASNGERIVSLDQEERILSEDDVVIADPDRGVAIAGIMGGLDTEVTDETRDILIEAAHFDPLCIRKTSKRLGLSSQASFRFERWVDPNSLPLALDRVTALLQEVAGGAIVAGWIDRYPKEVERVLIHLRPERVEKLLGMKIGTEKMVEYLESIDLRAIVKDDLIHVEVPTFRQDLKREVDLIEEIARLLGYDKFEAPDGSGSEVIARVDWLSSRRDLLKIHLISSGFREVCTTSFLGEDEISLLYPGADRADMWCLRNPISNDARVLRRSLLPGLLRVLKLNVNRNNSDLRIFELGTVFGPAIEDKKVPHESVRLAGLMVGKKSPVHWRDGSLDRCDYYDMKGVMSSLLRRMGCQRAKYLKTNMESFHPGKHVTIEVEGEEIGFFGELHPSLHKSFNVEDPPILFELDGHFFDRIERKQRFFEMSPFPSIKRDLSLLVPKGITHADLEESFRQTCGDLLEDNTLYDIYRGPQVPDDKSALTFALVFRSRDKTLKDEEVDGIMAKVFEEMAKEFSVTLRPETE